MKIAIIAPESFPRLWGKFAGGITQYVAAMAEGYSQHGHEVHIFARSIRPGTDRLGAAVVHFTRPAGGTGVRRVANIVVDELRTLRAVRRAGPFDLVEVIDWDAPALLSVYGSRRARLALKLHGPRDFIAFLNQQPLAPMARVAAWRERHLARRADLLTSADASLATKMAELWRLPAAPETIPDPVRPPAEATLAAATRSDGVLRIIAVGRLEHRKDQITLVRALAQLGTAAGEWHATFVGPDTDTGPDGGSYKAAMLAELDGTVAARVEWVEFASREELWERYAASDVAVVCTLDGNYGYSTLDPLTVGTAVVTTMPPGVTESPYVRHQETALIYPSADVGALVDRLRQLLADPQLAGQLGERGREHVLGTLSPRIIAGAVLDRLGAG